MKRPIEIGIVVIAATIILGVAAHFILRSRSASLHFKDDLRQIHQKIGVGFSRSDALAACEADQAGGLRLRTDAYTDTWDISMPFELGSTDWVLYIQFDNDSHVSGIAMRSSDGISIRPAAAPEDKGVFHVPLIKNKNG